MGVVRANVHKDSRLVTDTTTRYRMAPVANHEMVDHSKFEWTRGDVHTNTLEGFFSVLKRGLVGTYQHVDKKHLNRYLAEFDFRQNTRAALGIDDVQRAKAAIRGTLGKRLEALDRKRINQLDAFEMLDVQASNFAKLRAKVMEREAGYGWRP
jgi:hypothetical protein